VEVVDEQPAVETTSHSNQSEQVDSAPANDDSDSLQLEKVLKRHDGLAVR
jgi:hypothetical protein